MLRKTIIVVVLMTACLTHVSAQDRQDGQASRPRAVRVAKARRRILVETVTTSGTAAAARMSKLNFRVGGTVSEILVEMGDRVKKGQVLAKLDDANFKLYVEQARASYDAACASLEKVKAGFRPEE